jgi:hypothetical protein
MEGDMGRGLRFLVLTVVSLVLAALAFSPAATNAAVMTFDAGVIGDVCGGVPSIPHNSLTEDGIVACSSGALIQTRLVAGPFGGDMLRSTGVMDAGFFLANGNHFALLGFDFFGAPGNTLGSLMTGFRDGSAIAGLIVVGQGQTHVDLSHDPNWSDLNFVLWTSRHTFANDGSIDNFTVREIRPAAVPEPGSLGLLGVGLLALGAAGLGLRRLGQGFTRRRGRR